MKAALYIRVSTEEQALEGYSLEAQEEKLRLYCDVVADNLEVFKVYRDDGFSGRTTNRPAYRQMMDEMDQWDAIIVLKMDRIHRNTRNFMDMMDKLMKRNKEFLSATEDLDTTTANGRFVINIISNIAQLESERTGERTKFAMSEKAETLANTEAESRTMGFNPPYGYGLDNGLLVPVDAELEIVRRIYEEFLEGCSVNKLADSLNRDGIRTRRGSRWNKDNLGTVLHNPIYAGYLRWDGRLSRHYATTAVNVDTFNQAQLMLARHARNPQRRKTELICSGEDDKVSFIVADDFSDL